jgi:NitT/TauT family transport system substrate-binding protein
MRCTKRQKPGAQSKCKNKWTLTNANKHKKYAERPRSSTSYILEEEMFFRKLIVLAMFGIVLAACAAPTAAPTAPVSSSAASSQSSVAPTRPPTGAGSLRLALLPTIDVVPFYVAEAQGYFKQQGLNVELVPASSAAERDQLMATQQTDGEMTDLFSAVTFNATKPTLKVVRIVRQARSDAPLFSILVLKDSPIKTPQDLKGKEIAISQNTVIEYLTQRMLEKEGLSAADIKTTNIPAIPTRLQVLQQGQVPAANLPEPFTSLAVLQGARVVIDDSKYPEYSQSVLIFRTDIVTNRADDIKKFLVAYDKAIADIRATPDKFRNILIDKSRVPDPLKDKYQFPPFADPSITTKAQWDDVIKWSLDKKLITAPIAYETAISTDFVK